MKENKAGNDDLQEMIKKVQEELQRQNKQDVENCGKAIEAVLKKFDCRLEPVFVFTSKGMLPPPAVGSKTSGFLIPRVSACCTYQCRS